MPVDQAKLQDFIGKAVGEWGATLGVLLAFVGEWLAAEAAGGYVTYDAKTAKYSLPEEQALALTDESSPAYIAGGYQIMMSTFKDEEKVIQAFKTGKGLGWGDHNNHLFEGTERFFKPNYVSNLTSSWIPALDGVESKLKKC